MLLRSVEFSGMVFFFDLVAGYSNVEWARPFASVLLIVPRRLIWTIVSMRMCLLMNVYPVSRACDTVHLAVSLFIRLVCECKQV